MFGINGSFGLHAELTGQFELSKAEDMQAGLMTLLETLPLGKVVLPIVFAVVTIGFLATSLDSASFAIAVAGSKSLDSNGNPNTAFRLIMCVVLVLNPRGVPLHRRSLLRHQDPVHRPVDPVPVCDSGDAGGPVQVAESRPRQGRAAADRAKASENLTLDPNLIIKRQRIPTGFRRDALLLYPCEKKRGCLI